MRLIGVTELLVMFVVAIVLFNGKEKFARIVEALSNFLGGGPGSTSHPLPADDSKILNRHREPEHPENN
jgi:Sec-independent protein translocase protein TatA